MLAPIVFLILMVPVAPQLPDTTALQFPPPNINSLQNLFNVVIPDQVGILQNLPTILDEVCKNITQNVPRPNGTVKFILYTKNKPGGTPLYTGDVEGLLATEFDPARPTYFLIHGYVENRYTPCLIFPMSTVYLMLELELKINIIVMDYSEVFLYWLYFPATNVGLKEAAQQGARFIDFLHKNNLTDVNIMKLIGYSLGGQVAGAVGHELQKLYYLKIWMIIAIDPAGPAFYQRLCIYHLLSKLDAKYVQVIHIFANEAGLALGYPTSCGHVDYYINYHTFEQCCGDPIICHLAAPFIYEATLVDSTPLCACKRPNALDLTISRNCCEVRIPLGENNLGTVFGDYVVPYTIQMILKPVLRAFTKCLNVSSLSSGILGLTGL